MFPEEAVLLSISPSEILQLIVSTVLLYEAYTATE